MRFLDVILKDGRDVLNDERYAAFVAALRHSLTTHPQTYDDTAESFASFGFTQRELNLLKVLCQVNTAAQFIEELGLSISKYDFDTRTSPEAYQATFGREPWTLPNGGMFLAYNEWLHLMSDKPPRIPLPEALRETDAD